MLYGGFEPCKLEIRRGNRGGARLSGSFPYNSRAVLSDGGKRGRPRKEYFKSGAFRHSVRSKDQQIFLLSGHDFSKPLASKFSGSLELEDTDDALNFEAEISDEVLETSHGKDVIALLSAGLIGGISPGFRIPPEQTVPNAEEVTEENPSEGRALVRQINDAILFELSLVTAPAYPETEIQKRNWDVLRPLQSLANPRYRWRL